jgi:hypothetical protein
VLDAAEARKLATELLGAETRRWRHTAAVADQAERVAIHLAPDHAEQLLPAAWLHDIGYAASLNRTGFHPLDGARYLRERGEEQLACLTAHHSSSDVEAGHRGLDAELAQFPLPPAGLLAALTFCDMTSGPTGERVTVEERLAEILVRYGPDHLVGRSITDAGDSLRAAAARFAHFA